VVRKCCENIKRVTKPRLVGREFIVSNLTHALREGVPYRLYRLDVSNFYESFDKSAIRELVTRLPKLSAPTKAITTALLEQYWASGGTGLPRGLALSALLSELMMSNFDQSVKQLPRTFFYARYVDDILILTSAHEEAGYYISRLKAALPKGLSFHPSKRDIYQVKDVVSPLKPPATPAELFRFDYLGYAFHVSEPIKQADTRRGQHFRSVTVDISHSKIQRMKTRLARAFFYFGKDKNFEILLSRIKYLTSNFSVKDVNKNNFKQAGIYFSYPCLTEKHGLVEMDKFLKYATASKTGRAFHKSSSVLTAPQRRTLLKHSFQLGHEQKKFVYFSIPVISQIQKCWLHE
jgi:hypothetical protein